MQRVSLRLCSAFIVVVIFTIDYVVAGTGEPITPIPEIQHLDAGKVALGKMLFNDTNLSGDKTIACASCHHLGAGGMDNLVKSPGSNGVLTRVNTPTVFNSSLSFHQFWDGRSDTLEDQADRAEHDKTIMNTNWAQLAAYLAATPAYRTAFERLYPGLSVQKAASAAIAAFEASLLTPDSRFDRFLRGDLHAITADERQGYELFKSYGCASCHQGVAIGGNMFEKLGVMGDEGAYFRARGQITPADYGRFNLTHRAEDMYVFKVPSLRNVALTAPYLHDGSAATLQQVVAIMFQYQLGRTADAHDVDLIVQFLGTLTGRYLGKPLDNSTP